jgi:putative oxidoreductase
MSPLSEMTAARSSGLVGLVQSGLAALAALAAVAAPPVLRVALALPFLRSGLTRWDAPFHIAPATLYLFSDLFKLHLFGGEYPIPMSDLVATLTAVAEIALPVLLILGLATRLAGLGLLAMTGVIQLVMPDGWANFHLYWAAIALGIIAIGPGALSLDRLLFGRGISRPAMARNS